MLLLFDVRKVGDKDDYADALALACYCFEHMDTPRKFVQIREPNLVKIRELSLRLVRMRVAGKAVRLLFKQLVNSLT